MSSITGGQFNQIPFNAGGVNQFNNNLPPKEPLSKTPRKAQSEEETEIEIKEAKGDTFTPANVKPPEKPAFPVASTAIGGGVIGALGFGLSALCLPNNQPTELKEIEGKGVTIDKANNIVEHNGFEYHMEKADGKFKLKNLSAPVQIGQAKWMYESAENVDMRLSSTIKPIGAKGILEEAFQKLLGVKEGVENSNGFGVYVNEATAFVNSVNPDCDALIFDIDKDANGKMLLKESEHLRDLMKDKTKTHISQDHLNELKNFLMVDVQLADAHEKLASLKNPEPIENLIQGGGRKWGVIAAITAGAIAAGAGIGYLLGHKNPQQQSVPTVG